MRIHFDNSMIAKQHNQLQKLECPIKFLNNFLEKTVIRRRATSTLPLPLCIANFLVSSEWFLYGILVKDFYLIVSTRLYSTLTRSSQFPALTFCGSQNTDALQTPNGIGCMFATAQIIMFIVLPRKPGMRPPIVKLYRSVDYPSGPNLRLPVPALNSRLCRRIASCCCKIDDAAEKDVESDVEKGTVAYLNSNFKFKFGSKIKFEFCSCAR